MEKKPMPHLGELLNYYFTTHRTYKSVLAKRIGRDRTTLQRYIYRPSLQASILWELSQALEHNFFQDLADQLPASYATQTVRENNENEEIAKLRGELNLARAQLQVLKELFLQQKELPKKG